MEKIRVEHKVRAQGVFMTIYYSMKQILRSPVKSTLFLLLSGVSAFLLTLGGNLWAVNLAMLEEFEEIFVTVGTVEQKIDHVETYKIWDAETDDRYDQRAVHGKRISDEVMDFEGAGYILEAKQRPSFGALVDQRVMGSVYDSLIVEAAPVESGRADESFPMRAEKVLAGDEAVLKEGDIFYICDHYREEPRSFEAGTTYIMTLGHVNEVHGSRVEHIAPEDRVPEYMPDNSVASYQFTMDRELIYDAVAEAEDETAFDVVTEGFYETARGRRWLELVRSFDCQAYTIPVTPVDKTLLLMPFYWKEAQISKGRDITEEEYAEGKPVCLISSELSLVLRKEVGDRLALPLYYATYSEVSKMGIQAASVLNAQGKVYPVFDEQEYEIVGIYTAASGARNGYEMGRHQVVVPWNAIPENCWADNIAGNGPMRGFNTSFQIPNGTIGDFMAAWEKQGVEGLEIRFYDRGYSDLKNGIESRKLMAVIFLTSGCVLAVLILCFFSHLFITGQRGRIAVERLLGQTKRQCALSLLTGFFLLAAAGTGAGCGAGQMATGRAVKAAEQTTEFDAAFSNAVIVQTDTKENMLPAAKEKHGPGAAAAGIGMLLGAALIGFGVMRQELKKEPLKMLGEMEE